jgi:hypothetical protein
MPGVIAHTHPWILYILQPSLHLLISQFYGFHERLHEDMKFLKASQCHDSEMNETTFNRVNAKNNQLYMALTIQSVVV